MYLLVISPNTSEWSIAIQCDPNCKRTPPINVCNNPTTPAPIRPGIPSETKYCKSSCPEASPAPVTTPTYANIITSDFLFIVPPY